jgi:uncharacterized protein YbcI
LPSLPDVHLDLRPTRELAIVACMDSRLDVFAALGLRHGQAHVLRNTGGVITDDVIRSLAVSQRRLGTRRVLLIHHTDCGMQKLTDDGFRAELQKATGIAPAFAIESFADVDADVRQSVLRVRRSDFLLHRAVSCRFLGRRAHSPFMSPKQVEQPSRHGDVLTAISEGMVGLLKEFYGNGPTRTKSYYADDLVVCVLRGGFSRVEETLLDGGRGSAVIQQRMEFQDVMRHRFEEVIEAATGRPVIGFMSGNQQHPDMMCEVFILAPTDLLDEHETVVDGRGAPSG